MAILGPGPIPANLLGNGGIKQAVQNATGSIKSPAQVMTRQVSPPINPSNMVSQTQTAQKTPTIQEGPLGRSNRGLSRAIKNVSELAQDTQNLNETTTKNYPEITNDMPENINQSAADEKAIDDIYEDIHWLEKLRDGTADSWFPKKAWANNVNDLKENYPYVYYQMFDPDQAVNQYRDHPEEYILDRNDPGRLFDNFYGQLTGQAHDALDQQYKDDYNNANNIEKFWGISREDPSTEALEKWIAKYLYENRDIYGS